jgi:hypothetical protein
MKPTWFAVPFLLTATMTGCAREATPPGKRAEPADVSASAFPVDPALEDTIRLYMAKLGDRSYWTTYGHEDEPSTWYIAAERLGQIGAPAVPHLVGRLGTSDDYEEMLALYALMLAVQDTAVLSRTGREPIGYGSVLIGSDNAGNRRQALQWWARHRHLWGQQGQALDSATVSRHRPGAGGS